MAGLRLSVESSNAVSPLGRILVAVAACVLWVGICGSVLAACGTDLPLPAAVAGCVAAVCVIAAGCLLAGRGRSERVFYIASALVLVASGAILHASFAGGGAQLANGLIMSVGERTQEYALPFAIGTVGDLSFFSGVMGAAVALTCSLMAQHGNALPPIVVGAAALAGVVWGWLPIGWWLPMLAVGIFLMIAGRAVQSNDAIARPSLSWALIGVLAVCIVATGGTVLAMRSETADTQGAQAAIDRALWAVRYGNKTFAMPEGDLRTVGDLNASDQVAMTVTVDHPTFEYLRGFVGERYEDSEWHPLDAEVIMDSRDVLYWLDQDGFSAASQLSQAAGLAGYDDADPATLEIVLENVRGDYAYLPYGYESGSSARLTTDMAQTRLGGGGAQAVGFGSQITRRAYLLQNALHAAQENAATALAGTAETANLTNPAAEANSAGSANANEAALRLYLDDESAYRDFVEEAYLDIPDNVRDILEKLYGAPSNLTIEQAKVQVQYHLDNTVAYADGSEEDSETSASSESDGAALTDSAADDAASEAKLDFIEDFLTGKRSGYSVHYATAATLMLRYYGVPARYVEGYVLNTAQLDAEATANGSSDSDGEYILTERQAHAWVEYYLDGVGWLPFDITPGWRAGGYYETTPNTELINESQNWSVGEADADTVWNPPEPETPEENESALPPFLEQLDFLLVEWPWVLLGFVLTLIVAFIIRDVLLHVRLSRFLAQATDDTAVPNEAVPALFSYTVMLLRECGRAPIENAPFADQGRVVEEMNLCSSDAFERAAEANDRALFAEGGTTGRVASADVRAVSGCISQVVLGLRENVSAPRRFWQRHVRCLW